MKICLTIACALTLLTTNGCIVAEGGRHGHERHEAVVVGPPVVVVPVPVVVVHPH